MSKYADPRYDCVRVLIETGYITSVSQIFEFIPKTTVYRDLGVNFNRFNRAIKDPSIFRMQELIILAELFEVDAKKLIDMAYQQSLAVKYTRKKR